MAPSYSLRDTGDGRAPQVTGSEERKAGTVWGRSRAPQPVPRTVSATSWGRPGSRARRRELRAPGPSAVAAGECERGPGRPRARATGVAVGSLPPIPRGRTHKVVMGGSARASPAGARDRGRPPPTRAFPLKLLLSPGETWEVLGSGPPGCLFPHPTPHPWLLVARKICSVAGGLARDLADLLRVTKGHAH